MAGSEGRASAFKRASTIRADSPTWLDPARARRKSAPFAIVGSACALTDAGVDRGQPGDQAGAEPSPIGEHGEEAASLGANPTLQDVNVF